MQMIRHLPSHLQPHTVRSKRSKRAAIRYCILLPGLAPRKPVLDQQRSKGPAPSTLTDIHRGAELQRSSKSSIHQVSIRHSLLSLNIFPRSGGVEGFDLHCTQQGHSTSDPATLSLSTPSPPHPSTSTSPFFGEMFSENRV